MGTDLYKQDLGSIPPVSRLWRVAPDALDIPGSELGTRNRGQKHLPIFDWEHRRLRNPTFHFSKIAGGLDCPNRAA